MSFTLETNALSMISERLRIDKPLAFVRVRDYMCEIFGWEAQMEKLNRKFERMYDGRKMTEKKFGD